MCNSRELKLKAGNMIPAMVNPGMKIVMLNNGNPISIKPAVEGTERNKNYPIIFIPGVMGSRLFDIKLFSLDPLDSKGIIQIWPPVKKPLLEFSSPTLSQIDKLEIKNKLYTHDYRVEQVREKKLIKDFKVDTVISELFLRDREYGADDSYKNLINRLCKEFPEREIYFFSYDWRQSNMNTSYVLSKFITQILKERPGDKDAKTETIHSLGKIDLVCHSMGGLVASALCTYLSTDKINKVITLGTPYEGSPNLLRAVLTNKVLGGVTDWFLQLTGLTKELKLHLSGVTQLAPTQSYVNIVPQHILYHEKLKDKNNFKNNSKTTTLKDADINKYKKFGRSVFVESPSYDEIAGFQNTISNGLLGLKNAYFGIGGGQETLRSLVIYKQTADVTIEKKGTSTDTKTSIKNELECIDATFEFIGDGTVPYLSANKIKKINPSDLGTERVKYFHNTTHTGVANDPAPVDWVIDILKDGKSTKGSNDPPGDEDHIDVRIACPVDVVISNGAASLNSGAANMNLTTDFGKLFFLGREGDIKLACLKTNNYTVQLQGTDTGTMDYAIRFFDANNTVVETRDFYNVPVNKNTCITTEIKSEEPSVLKDKTKNYKPQITKHYHATSKKIPEIKIGHKEFTAIDAVDLYNNAEIADDTKTIDLSTYYNLPFDVAKAWLALAKNDEITLKIISYQTVTDDKNHLYPLSVFHAALNKELSGDIVLKPTLYVTQEEHQYIEFPITIPKNRIVIDTEQLEPNGQTITINIRWDQIPFDYEKLIIYTCSIYGRIEQLDSECWFVDDNDISFTVTDVKNIIVSDYEIG